MGYQVILDVGMSGMKVDFPDSTCWSLKDGKIRVGEGGLDDTTNKIKGERHGYFNYNKVAGIIDMDDSS